MKIKKILITLIGIVSISFIFNCNAVQAALQSNGQTPATKNRDTWMTQIRAMESQGAGFGLTESIKADLTSSTGSNNIDIHMQKNTEYGAMALLSASSYGNPNKIGNGETTTGNSSGVVIPYNKEWTATQYTDYVGKTSFADRYIDYYVGSSWERKKGDGLLETQGWHSTTYVYAHGQNGGYNYCYVTPYGLVRNIGNGIFGFNNSGGWIQFNKWYWDSRFNIDSTTQISNAYTSRAVIINGEGI